MPSGATRTIRQAWPAPSTLLAATGAAGCSIEDFDPAHGVDRAARRGRRAGGGGGIGGQAGMVLTARAEHHLYGPADLDDTIARLCAYRDAGAEVLYAPGLVDLDQIDGGRARRRASDQRAQAAGGSGRRHARRCRCAPRVHRRRAWPARPTRRCVTRRRRCSTSCRADGQPSARDGVGAAPTRRRAGPARRPGCVAEAARRRRCGSRCHGRRGPRVRAASPASGRTCSDTTTRSPTSRPTGSA